MLTRILTVILFLVIMGLLVAQRFLSTPPQLTVTVTDVAGASAFVTGEEAHRGQTIETNDGYIKLSIDDVVSLWLASNTQIELHRLFEDEFAIRFTKGRMVIDHQGTFPLKIQTDFTSSSVLGDVASFVNYDFLETIHVIPLSGFVQVSIDSIGEQLLTDVPISIHETDPVAIDKLDVNLQAGDAANFYHWVFSQSMIPPPSTFSPS